MATQGAKASTVTKFSWGIISNHSTWNIRFQKHFFLYANSSIFVVCDLNLPETHLMKGLTMVARAFWRSEARRVQGRSQGTTLSASDLHNARATIFSPLYTMEYKIIKKIRQNTTWIEADILGINLTPNRYNVLAPPIFYVSNDVTIPFNSVTSQ